MIDPGCGEAIRFVTAIITVQLGEQKKPRFLVEAF